MTIHSVATPRPFARRDPPPGPKRDAILRAAIDVFADRGFFNAQVADVARAAGVAAGTVYLYFRSKDDLLVSIFERTMREALARRARGGRPTCAIRASGCAASRALHLAPPRPRSQPRRSSSRWSCGSRPSSWSASPSTLLRDYLGLIRDAIADGQRAGPVPQPTSSRPSPRRCFFGALDEMATNWILSRRRYSLEADADTVVDLFVNGARAR